MIHMQKTFNVTNHKILRNKLLPTDFSENTITWYNQHSIILLKKLQVGFQNSQMFFIYVNDKRKAAKSGFYLCTGDSCLLLQHKEVNKIKYSSPKTSAIFLNGLLTTT